MSVMCVCMCVCIIILCYVDFLFSILSHPKMKSSHDDAPNLHT